MFLSNFCKGPGSKEAREKGCTCPIINNRIEKETKQEIGIGVFLRKQGCPLHDPEFKVLPSEEELYP